MTLAVENNATSKSLNFDPYICGLVLTLEMATMEMRLVKPAKEQFNTHYNLPHCIKVWYYFLDGLHVTNPPIRLMCPTSVCPSTFFVSGL